MTEASPQAVIIMTTVANKADAAEMAGHLIAEHVAACVQEIAIQSHFHWDGQTSCEAEILLLVKTAADRVDDAMAAIRTRHKYQVPEILVVPATTGFGPYLQWIAAETRGRN